MSLPWAVEQIKGLRAKFPIGIPDGGTGGTTAATARAALDLLSSAEIKALIAAGGGGAFKNVWVSGLYAPTRGVKIVASHNLNLADVTKAFGHMQAVCVQAINGYEVGDTAEFLQYVNSSGYWSGYEPNVRKNTIDFMPGAVDWLIVSKVTGGITWWQTNPTYWQARFRIWY